MRSSKRSRSINDNELLLYLGRHRTIYCIGDSNTLAFDEMVFRSEPSDVLVACRALYFPGILAKDLLNPDGSLYGPLKAQLIAQSLCIENDGQLKATHTSDDKHWRHVEVARDRHFSEPVLLFHFGDLDLRFMAIPRLAPSNDFMFPQAPAGSMLAVTDPSREIIPYSLVRDMAHSALEPYMNALAFLKRAGFRRVFAHTLAPQVEDEEAYAVFYGRAPLALRYKMLHVFNDTLRELAKKRAIDLIDTWNETTIGGLLNPAYNLDNAHLNSAASRISIAKLVESLKRPGSCAPRN